MSDSNSLFNLDNLVAFGLLAGMIYGMVRFSLKDIHRDLQDIRSDIAKINTRLDRSEDRIDHLYQICIEMLGTRHKH